ncbi:MAG: death domain-containing protein [Endozoicomonadaceae bacterium]|nr:death domain-containing protein [Endozoicomonadaceae bacterium]
MFKMIKWCTVFSVTTLLFFGEIAQAMGGIPSKQTNRSDAGACHSSSSSQSNHSQNRSLDLNKLMSVVAPEITSRWQSVCFQLINNNTAALITITTGKDSEEAKIMTGFKYWKENCPKTYNFATLKEALKTHGFKSLVKKLTEDELLEDPVSESVAVTETVPVGVLPSVGILVEELYGYVKDIYGLGLQLLEQYEIDTIEYNYGDDAQKMLTEVFVRWTDNYPDASLDQLLQALRNMQLVVLAEKLEAKYNSQHPISPTQQNISDHNPCVSVKTASQQVLPLDILFEELCGHASHARKLGFKLLDHREMNIIEFNRDGSCLLMLRDILTKWTETDVDASWDKLLQALRSIDLNTLAHDLEKKYNLETRTSDTHQNECPKLSEYEHQLTYEQTGITTQLQSTDGIYQTQLKKLEHENQQLTQKLQALKNHNAKMKVAAMSLGLGSELQEHPSADNQMPVNQPEDVQDIIIPPQAQARPFHKNLVAFYASFSPFWYKIGKQLNVRKGDLDIIEVDVRGNSKKQTRLMLQKWFNQDTSASFVKLANAVYMVVSMSDVNDAQQRAVQLYQDIINASLPAE